MRPLLLFVVIGLASPSLTGGQLTGSKTIRIDGNETPERIPDHIVWRNNFLRLSEIKKLGAEADLAYDLPLSKPDADVFYKEAVLQPQRDADCHKRMVTKREELGQQNASTQAASQALTEITIDCRTKDLDAADRVMDALTEEGRTILSVWIEKRRRTVVAFVAESDLETFKLPR
jgi:hypothetical protein